MPSSYYEIRVSGVLPPEALLDFDRLTASVEPVETVVHGALQDQAALNGLLARLEAFGVEVIEVRRLHEKDQSAGEATHDRSGPQHGAGRIRLCHELPNEQGACPAAGYPFAGMAGEDCVPSCQAVAPAAIAARA